MYILILRRVFAFIVDFILSTTLFFGITIGLIMIVLLIPELLIPGLGTAIFINNYQATGIFPTISLRSIYIIGTIYSVFFHYVFRATPGKLIFNLRLTTIKPEISLSIIKLSIRELIKNLLSVISIISLFSTKGEIALHDYFVETKVLERSKAHEFNHPTIFKIILILGAGLILSLITIVWDLISYTSQLQ